MKLIIISIVAITIIALAYGAYDVAKEGININVNVNVTGLDIINESQFQNLINEEWKPNLKSALSAIND